MLSITTYEVIAKPVPAQNAGREMRFFWRFNRKVSIGPKVQIRRYARLADQTLPIWPMPLLL